MALRFDNNIFFHIQRTAGKYTRRVINEISGSTKETGHPHSCAYGEFHKNSFCIIREPTTWYHSFYRHTITKSRQWRRNYKVEVFYWSRNLKKYVKIHDRYKPGESSFDSENMSPASIVKKMTDETYIGFHLHNTCDPSSFENFVRSSIKRYPYGFLTRIYALHVPYCEHVVRFENLKAELPKLFEHLGYEFPYQVKKCNKSKGKSWLSNNTKELLLLTEKNWDRIVTKNQRGFLND